MYHLLIQHSFLEVGANCCQPYLAATRHPWLRGEMQDTSWEFVSIGGPVSRGGFASQYSCKAKDTRPKVGRMN